MKISWAGTATNEGAVYSILPWKAYIEEVTQGRVKVDFYPDASLHSYKDTYGAIESGVTDFAYHWNAYLPGRLPLTDVFHLPGLMASQAVSDMVVRELYERYPCFTEQYGDKIQVMWAAVHMRSDLHSIEPIRNLEDLQGKVVACTSATGAEALAALGASTTVMVASDAYLALDKGAVDAAFAAWGWVKTWKMDEVTNYHSLLCLCPGSSSWLFNKKTFDRFTPHEQMLLKHWWCEGARRTVIANAYQSEAVRAPLAEEQFIEWPAEDMAKMRALFKPTWDKWAEEMEALGYPGKDILKDAIRFTELFSYA